MCRLWNRVPTKEGYLKLPCDDAAESLTTRLLDYFLSVMSEKAQETKLASSVELRAVEPAGEGPAESPHIGVEGIVSSATKKSIRRERHAYYAYFTGNNGIGPFVL